MNQTLQDIIDENFARRGELGASVSVWRGGEEVVSLAGGFCDRAKTEPWSAHTPVLVWSATKGPASACVLHCLHENRLSLATKLADIWPEFGQAGKQDITMAQLMSHQAGLAAMSEEISVFDRDGIVAALARQAPLWPPGTQHGYHPRTFGFLLDEIIRRLSGGITLGEYWRKVFARPMQLDFWIGLPEEKLEAVAPIHSPRVAPGRPLDTPFHRAFANPQSLTCRAFRSPVGLHSLASMNTREARMASFPAFGGIGTASALAKFYAMLANGGELDGVRFFPPFALDWMTTTLIRGFDPVLQVETAFSAGFMKDARCEAKERIAESHGGAYAGSEPGHLRLFGPSRLAFGHPGAGGSVAFADPENEIAFAYVMNQMETGVLPNEKSLLLIDALYS
jgi:CubicO group peptidase (beta-lactamase class C family)